jgi:dihydroneopterin aldolase
MQEITLRGMRFHALVGILPHERTMAQPIEVDLSIQVGDGVGVIDYRALYAIVASALESGRTDFLEEVGERIARETLAHSPRVRNARVAVRKPHVALPGPLAYAEVVVEHRADG